MDDAFLEEIERWRDVLARNIAIRNPNLTQRELNFSVQRTIDRIVFLRICEDRGIEPYGRLMTLKNGERVYPRLCEFFQRADERYNSGLFHFQTEKERPQCPDELTLHLDIDDKAIREIIGNLYYPESPYEFSVLPADILGQVYERFLGKVIRLPAQRRRNTVMNPSRFSKTPSKRIPAAPRRNRPGPFWQSMPRSWSEKGCRQPREASSLLSQ